MKRLKRLLLAMTFIVGFSTLLQSASPVFLICGTYPAGENQPTAFLVSIDSAAAISVSPTPFNGGIRVHYNVSTLAPGAHTVSVAAKNMWGTSAFSTPKNFTVATPTVPDQIGFTTQ